MKVVGLFVAAASLLADQSLDLNDRPVSKVLKLLKDMQNQLNDDKKAETEQYEKMSCWCESNRKGKTTATEIATSRVENLEHRIKALTAKASELESTIKALNDEIASNTEALNTATAMREKEAAEFHSDETDLLTSLESLKAAMVMLKKHQAFLQTDSVSVSVKKLQKVVDDNDALINQILQPSARSQLAAFMQAPQAYTSQSGEIFGIMEQMQENFEGNLAGARKDEGKAKAAFAELKAAKTEEINTGTDQAKEHGQVLARTREELEQAKEDHRDTSDALSADQAFLVDLEKRCAAADADWVTRSKTRADEISAVSEAISILSNDDAHDTFQRSLGFLQLHASKKSQREAAAKILLLQASKRSGAEAAALAQLASSAKLDAFTKVQAAIDDMVTALKQQQDDEVKHKDFCKSEFQKNDQETFKTDNEIKDLGSDIEQFGATIETLATNIAQVQAEIADSQVELQRANENRVAQNQEFQTVVADQRATQVILKKALDRLNKFYGFVQTSQEPGAAVAPPPEPMKAYKANAGAGGVLTMIGNILTDAANMEKEAIAGEQDSQDAYIAFAKETFASIAAASASATNKAEEKAGAEKAKVGAEADRADALSRAEGLNKYKGELHKQCDYVLNNFDARQTARREELDSLQAAKAALKTA